MKKTACTVLTALTLLFTSAHAQAAFQSQATLAGKKTVIWDNGMPGKKPVLFFSHGFQGCATQSASLMAGLADAGYIIFAINHSDSVCGNKGPSVLGGHASNFVKEPQWDDKAYRDRAEDLRSLMSAIRTSISYKDRVDWGKFGLIGHSLGGYTVLGLAGGWPSWTMPEVKAVLVFTPYCLPFSEQKSLGGLVAPVMYQGGGADPFITGTIKAKNGCYAQSAKPKYYVEMQNAGQQSWTDVRRESHPTILAYSISFMDYYLKKADTSSMLSRAFGDASAVFHDGY